ncbi:hypothetical protein ACR6HW_04105 [Fusibacter sp. JL298sf-3]
MTSYKESGKFNVARVFWMLLLSSALTLPFAGIYSCVITYIPFVYFNGIVTAIYGVIVGFIVLSVGKSAHIRNHKVMKLVGTVVSLFAVYAQWVFWLKLLSNDVWILNPLDVLKAIKAILPTGTWGLGTRGSIPVRGIFLALVWLVEAIAIVVFCLSTATLKEVYCERCKRWVKEETKGFCRMPEEFDAFKRVLSSGDMSCLDDLEVVKPEEEGYYLEFTFGLCAECKEVGRLTLSKLEYYLNSKDKLKKSSETVLEMMVIDKAQYDAFKARF